MNQNMRSNSGRGRSRPINVRHALTLLVLTGVLAATGLATAVWWQDRPLRQAAAYLEEGDPEKALSTIDAFLRDHRSDGKAMSLRARTLVAVGRPAQAIDLFERFGVSSPKELHAWAQALLQLERWHAALPILEHLTTTGVDRADVLHELAACRSEAGDLSGAIAAAREFARQPGFSARGNVLLGSLYRKQGSLREALAAWGDVLKDEPDADRLQISAADFFLDYGRVLFISGFSELAAENLERSLKLRPNADAFVVLGNARSILEDHAAAENGYKQALALDPDLAAARVGLARLALSTGDPAGTKEWLSTISSPGKLTSEVAVLLQQSSMKLGEVAEAEKWRDKADKLVAVERFRGMALRVLQDAPDSNLALVVRAYQFAESGNWVDAESILRTITASEANQQFIDELLRAVERRSSLPSLELLPLKPF